MYSHWWRFRADSTTFYPGLYDIQTYDVYSSSGYNISETFTVADSVTFDENGKVYLVGAENVTTNYNSQNSGNTFVSLFAGKYFHEGSVTDSDALLPDYVYYAYPDTDGTHSNKDADGTWYRLTLTKVSRVFAAIVTTEWNYLSGASQDTYPVGTVDGIVWEYLGVPFENARTPHNKIAIGTYKGVNKYGSSNPTKLTFDFPPKFIFIFGDAWAYHTFGIQGQNMVCYYDDDATSMSTTWADNKVSFFHGSSSSTQMNRSDTTYRYLALG